MCLAYNRGMRKRQKSKPKKKDRLEVLLEHMDGKIGSIAEQHGSIDRRLSGIDKTLNAHTETLNGHTQMIAHLTVTTEAMREDIATIKSGLKKKVDYDEFSALERRVLVLERRR